MNCERKLPFPTAALSASMTLSVGSSALDGKKPKPKLLTNGLHGPWASSERQEWK